MRYYIADLHFCHGNLNDNMDCRGFSSVEEMNQHMIDKWNSRVRSNDEVVILGDFCISTTGKEVNEILARLKGRKYLIVGNHDKYIERRSFDQSQFKWIENYKEIKDNKRKVILSHYPIMCYNGQYHFDSEGPKTYMLYGHVHNTYDEVLVNNYIKEVSKHTRHIDNLGREVTVPCQMINCFCMFSDYVPLTLDEWIEVDKKRREKFDVGSSIS
ncbi:MAG: metallophosphoesterase [Lachnospiraceae bacterium]|nr:metallophosphoesterase [Lachnospiraceae bacterium]